MGIEKLIPRAERPGRLPAPARPLSAPASRSRTYSSHFHGPRPGGELHIVLVDNGRSELLGSADFSPLAQLHPLRRVPEHLPGLSAQRRAQLRRDRPGPIGSIIDPRSTAQIQRAAVRLDPVRLLHRRLPGEDRHPRADLPLAPGHQRAQPASDHQEGGDAHGGQGARQSAGSIAPR